MHQGKFITVTEKALSSSWFFFSVRVCMKQPLVAKGWQRMSKDGKKENEPGPSGLE